MIDKGYTSSYLVKDRPNPGLDILQISKACLEYSDVNFLIFTFAGKRFGVVREPAHCASSSTMTDRRWRCVVCYEVKGKRSALPPLSNQELEQLQISRMITIPFSTEEELKQAIVGTAWKYLNELAEGLRDRKR